MSNASKRSLSAQQAYAENVLHRPTYHDGTPRKTWEQLGYEARLGWARSAMTYAEGTDMARAAHEIALSPTPGAST